MDEHLKRFTHWCRWCGREYMSDKPLARDGFCKAHCRQAHYRAYKNYVTHKTHVAAGPAIPRGRHK